MRKRLVNPLLLVLAFKPPTGAIFAVQLYRRLRRRSILEDAASFFPTSWSLSRSLDLDASDRQYELEGGVSFVRVELYRALLRGAKTASSPLPAASAASPASAAPASVASVAATASPTTTSSSTSAATSSTTSAPPDETAKVETTEGGRHVRPSAELSADEAHVHELIRSLGLSCGPGSSREAFVRSSSEALRRLHTLRASSRHLNPSAPGPWRARRQALAFASPLSSAGARVAAFSGPVEAVVELRMADSLLRLLRDKLLLSAKILEQAQVRGAADSHCVCSAAL